MEKDLSVNTDVSFLLSGLQSIFWKTLDFSWKREEIEMSDSFLRHSRRLPLLDLQNSLS